MLLELIMEGYPERAASNQPFSPLRRQGSSTCLLVLMPHGCSGRGLTKVFGGKKRNCSGDRLQCQLDWKEPSPAGWLAVLHVHLLSTDSCTSSSVDDVRDASPGSGPHSACSAGCLLTLHLNCLTCKVETVVIPGLMAHRED